jgi:hypothetical protein
MFWSFILQMRSSRPIVRPGKIPREFALSHENKIHIDKTRQPASFTLRRLKHCLWNADNKEFLKGDRP